MGELRANNVKFHFEAPVHSLEHCMRCGGPILPGDSSRIVYNVTLNGVSEAGRTHSACPITDSPRPVLG